MALNADNLDPDYADMYGLGRHQRSRSVHPATPFDVDDDYASGRMMIERQEGGDGGESAGRKEGKRQSKSTQETVGEEEKVYGVLDLV
jgi:hypothetical protein